MKIDRFPQIISLGFAVPRNRYTQEEVFARLGYPGRYYRIFRDSGIAYRHFWIDLERIPELSFQEQQEEYQKGALELSLQSVRECLDGRSVAGIGCVIYSSCTGFCQGPTIPHYLARELRFLPDTYFCNIGSMGCEGGYPGLKRAADFTLATGKYSLAVACELSSCASFPETPVAPDPANDLEILRSNAIFADGACCALIGYDNCWRHPAIIDTETYTNTDYIRELGFTWQDGRLRIRLARSIPGIVAGMAGVCARNLLKRNGLEISGIQWFVIHAAGKSVIDKIRDELGIREEKTRLSRQTLMDFGNTSSSSIGITGKRLMAENIRKGDYVMVLSIGPGITCGSTLLRFG